MKYAKMISVLAVLTMMFSSFAIVIATGNDSSATDSNLEDQGIVKLEADKDFTANQQELAKLGITDQKCWVHQSGVGTTFTLENVNYKTTESVALQIVQSATNTEKLEIVLKGENSFVSKETVVNNSPFCGIDITGNYAEVKFSGTGSLLAKNEGTSTASWNRGISITVTPECTQDVIFDGCKVTGIAGDVEQPKNNTNDIDGSSNGIYTDGNVKIQNNAEVCGFAGDVSTHGKPTTKVMLGEARTFYYVAANGVTVCGNIEMNDGKLVGFGGDITSDYQFEKDEFETQKFISVKSYPTESASTERLLPPNRKWQDMPVTRVAHRLKKSPQEQTSVPNP